MAEPNIGLTQLANDEHGERFQVNYIEEQKRATPGYTMTTSAPITEARARAFLEQLGAPLIEISAMFRGARDAKGHQH